MSKTFIIPKENDGRRKEMGNLIKAELIKLSKSLTCISAVYFAFLIIYISYRIFSGNLSACTGAEWLCEMHSSPAYIFFISIFAANYVAGEFQNQTFAASLLCGFPRGNVFWAKTITFFLGALPAMLINALTGMVILTLKSGFAMEFNVSTFLFLGEMLVYCLLALLAYGSICFFSAMLTKNRVATIGVSLGLIQIFGIIGARIEYIENQMIRWLLEIIYRFTIYWQVGELLGTHPDIHISLWFSVFSTSVITVFILLAAEHLFRTCDLK